MADSGFVTNGLLATLAEVHQLNNEGVLVAAMVDDIGKATEIAQDKFGQAIQLVESLVSTVTAPATDQHSKKRKTRDFDSPVIAPANKHAKRHNRATGSGDSCTTPSDTTITLTPTRTQQRALYDEGMTTFSSSDSFIALQPSDGPWRSMIVLTFNLGLCLLRSSDSQKDGGEMALHFFERSRELLSTKLVINDNNEHEDNVRLAGALLHNIAYLHYRNGRYSDALLAYGDTLKFIGDHHPKLTSAILNCIGVVQFHTSRPGEGCLHLFQGALEIIRNDHTRYNDPFVQTRAMATTLNNIARVQYMMGDYTQALESYKEAIAIRRQIYGPDHIDVAAVAFNMGQAYHMTGELDRALQYFNEHLRIMRLTLSDMHREVGDVLRHIAQIHYDRGEKQQALRIYEEALRVTRSALGPNHHDAAAILNKQGNIQYELGDLTAALQTYKEGLRIELLTLDPYHPNIIVTRGNIARIHKDHGQFNAALTEYETMLKMQRHNNKRRRIVDDPSTATIIYNTGLVRYLMGEFEEAFDCYQQALHIRRDAYGDDHLDVASLLNSIGLALFRQGFAESAKESFDECLRIRRKLLGSEHRDVAVVLFNIATIMFEQGDEDDAMKALLETLRVERAVLGENHPDVIQTAQHIGHMYQDRGDLHNAIKYFEESLRVKEAMCGSSSRQVAKVLNHLGNLHMRLGKAERAMSCFTRAERIHRGLDGVEEGNVDSLVISGYELYDMSKVHPECAAVA